MKTFRAWSPELETQDDAREVRPPVPSCSAREAAEYFALKHFRWDEPFVTHLVSIEFEGRVTEWVVEAEMVPVFRATERKEKP